MKLSKLFALLSWLSVLAIIWLVLMDVIELSVIVWAAFLFLVLVGTVSGIISGAMADQKLRKP